MTLCEQCRAIETGKRGAPGHAALRITGTERRKPPGAPAVTVSTFVCAACGAAWVHYDDKHDEGRGWSLAEGQAA